MGTLLRALTGLALLMMLPVRAAEPVQGTTPGALQATPPKLLAFKLNQGVAITYDPTLLLTWSLSGGVATHMRVSESPGFPGAAWNPVPVAQPWKWLPMSLSEGVKKVHIQFMNDHGLSEPLHSQIEYRAPPKLISFKIEKGSASTSSKSVNVMAVYEGVASHFRIGILPGMGDWQTASSPITLNFPLYDTADQAMNTLYFELRRETSAGIKAQASIRYEETRKDFEVKGTDMQALYTRAASSGFSEAAQKLTGGDGSCMRNQEYFIASQGVNGAPVRCQFKLFQGRNLRVPWTVKSTLLGFGLLLSSSLSMESEKKYWSAQSTCKFIQQPMPGSNQAALIIELYDPGSIVKAATDPGSASESKTMCRIAKMVLNGPASKMAVNAFDR